MRKSSDLSHHYRPGTSRRHRTATTFREQMTDYARGEVLRELRAKTRKSRESVAADIGITTKTLFTWENHNGPIKWPNAQRIAAYYNVEPEALITRDADEANGLPSREQLDSIERKLDCLLEYFELDPDAERRKTFTNAFRAMAPDRPQR